MTGLFGGFYFLLLCLWRHWLRLPAETLGMLCVLPAPTLFLSWCVLLALECLSSPRVAFSLELITAILRQESLFYYPSASLSGSCCPALYGLAGRDRTVGLHPLSGTIYRLTSALFLWHYFVGMLTSCFDNKEWVCINWENALAHLHLLYEPIRQLPPCCCNWNLGE